MALDAATLALTAAELKTTLADAKIAKLFEPTRDELVITLRTRTETDSLLLSARSGSARVCLTEESLENPETPPSFCMLMRKHLTGGRLLDVRMEPGDRIVYFEFQCTNEMGDLVRNILCAELMGRYSNLVLVQNGKIIDALKRVDFEDSDVRQLLPGLPYTTPPKPARPDFLAVSSASIVAAACQRDLPVADALNKTVAGVGPDNMFIFGMSSDEVIAHEHNRDYDPMQIFNTDQDIRKVLTQLVNGFYSPNDSELFRDLYNSLLNTHSTQYADTYFILADFRSYAEAQKKIMEYYKNKSAWAKSAILNTAHSGKFSSDRTIQEYVDDIWHLPKVKVDVE